MSVTYAGDPDSFPATATVIDDGDLPAAATIAPADEAVLDRTAYLKARLIGPQVVVPMVPLNVYGLSNEGGAVADRFIFSTVANLGAGWLQTDVTDAGALAFALSPHLPHKCRIVSVEARFACLNQAGLPGTMPQMSLIKEDSTGLITPVVLATKVDPSNEATFESSHIVYIDCAADIGAVIDFDSSNDILYYVSILGQTGVNAAANKFMVKQLYAIIEVPA